MKWESGRPELSVGMSGFCSGYSEVARNNEGVWIVPLHRRGSGRRGERPTSRSPAANPIAQVTFLDWDKLSNLGEVMGDPVSGFLAASDNFPPPSISVDQPRFPEGILSTWANDEPPVLSMLDEFIASLYQMLLPCRDPEQLYATALQQESTILDYPPLQGSVLVCHWALGPRGTNCFATGRR